MPFPPFISAVIWCGRRFWGGSFALALHYTRPESIAETRSMVQDKSQDGVAGIDKERSMKRLLRKGYVKRQAQDSPSVVPVEWIVAWMRSRQRKRDV